MSPEKPLTSFTTTSYLDWIEQIKKDLKGKEIGTLDWEIDAQIKISPFQHIETHKGDNRIQRKLGSWNIGQQLHIDHQNLAKLNHILIEALRNGLNAPELIITNPLYLDDFHIIFENVIDDYITLTFAAKDFEDLRTTILEFDQYLTAKNAIKGSSSLNIKYNGDLLQLSDLYLRFKDDYPLWRFFAIPEISLAEDDSQTNSSAKCVQSTIDLLKSLALAMNIKPYHLISRVGWYLESSSLFYVNICRMRAMRWVWGLVLESWDEESYLEPYFDVQIPQRNEDPNLALIEATSECISNALGGASRISINMNQFDYQRLGRNIQNIMQLESKIDQVVDPAEGSYYLEKLTEQMAETIWTHISL